MLQKYFSLKGFIRYSEQLKVYTSKPHRGKIFINALICYLPIMKKKKKQLPVFYQQAAVFTGGNLLAKNNIY